MNLNFKADLPHPYLLALGLFLVFSGVRIHLIMVYGSQTPYWDDWAMGTRMAMYLESGFDPTWLYGLTNEHRATFSKLTNLFLFKANNHQWDPYVTMVLDAFIWAAIGIILLYIGFREKEKINPWLFSCLVIVLWTYPLSLFNTLSTIQTYIYYMSLLVICGFWLLTYKALSLTWWCGIFCVAAACMTAGGGSFAPIAVTSTSVFLAIFGQQHRKQHIITAAVAGIFAIFGMYLVLSQGSAGVSGSKAFGPFLVSLFKTLSWPSSNRAWPSIVFLTPITLLALGICFKKIPQSRIATFTLMMAGFGIMLSIAIAYARGVNGSGPAERYFDFLTIYLVASALSLMLIQGNTSKLASNLNSSLAVVWFLMLLIAIPYHLKVSKFQLNDRASLVPVQEDIMARYSVTADPELFKNRNFREVPFPFPNILEGMMKRLNETDALAYNLQSSSMNLNVSGNAFTMNGIIDPGNSKYKGLENVLGSFNLSSGAQNATGEFSSEVFVARRPYIMVPVSGYLGFKGTSLTLVGESNGNTVEVKPKTLSSSRESDWSEVLVKAPDTEFRIVAKDESTNLWFAFAAPRSVGRISYFVDRIMGFGPNIWVAGLILLVIAFRQRVSRLVSLKAKQNGS